MKILQVLHNYPPEFRGGVERSVESLAASLLSHGHEVAILAGSERKESETRLTEEVWEGVPVHRFVRKDGLHTTVHPFDPGFIPVYEDLLRRLSPDVVHVHHHWNLGDDLVRRATARGHATVLTLHDFFSTCSLFFRMPDGDEPCLLPQGKEACAPCLGNRFHIPAENVGWLADLRARSFAREVDAAGAAIVPSRSHGRAVSAWLDTERELRAVPLGSRALSPLPPEGTPFPEGPLRVLHFGNLSRLKGVEVLAAAARRVVERGGALALTLAGDLVEPGLDISGADFVGSYDEESLRRLAAASDLAVFPSHALESYGLAVDEAMRLGLPVVVSDRGALAERVGGRGLVVPAGDTGALTAAFEDLLREPARLAALRDGAPGELASPDEHALAVAGIYDEVLARPRPEVDLETPLLERLQLVTERLPILLGLDTGQAGSAETPVPEDTMEDRTGERPTGSGGQAPYAVHATTDVDATGTLVSVITRTRNRRELLQEAVASVAAQDHPDLELVVVNDGGVDVADILDPYRERLAITYVRPGGVGRCRAGNLGLEAARGTWIAWLDDDDLHYPNHISTLLTRLTETGLKVAYSDAHRIDQRPEGPDGEWIEVNRSVPYSEDFSRLMLFRRAYIHLVTVMHHRECFEKLGGLDVTLEVLEDWDMFFRFAQDYEFAHVAEVTAAFRIRDDETNAVTAMRKEFVETRTRLFSRYIHVAFPELLGLLDRGQHEIGILSARVAELERLLSRDVPLGGKLPLSGEPPLSGSHPTKGEPIS